MEPDREPTGPLFVFGLVADVQYADKDDEGAHRYRLSLERLRRAAADLARRRLAFMVQLGDVIDGRDPEGASRADLEAALEPLESLGTPLVHVIGNHCLSVPRAELLARLGLERAWYRVDRAGWRFLVLDSQDAEPVHAGPEDWSGAIGREQLAWLADELAAADAAGERVVVLCHHPMLPEAARARFLLDNREEVLALLEASPSVVAVLSGHDHRGGHGRRGGVHHWTVPAMLTAPRGSNAYALVEVWPRCLEVRGVGQVADLTLSGR